MFGLSHLPNPTKPLSYINILAWNTLPAGVEAVIMSHRRSNYATEASEKLTNFSNNIIIGIELFGYHDALSSFLSELIQISRPHHSSDSSYLNLDTETPFSNSLSEQSLSELNPHSCSDTKTPVW